MTTPRLPANDICDMCDEPIHVPTNGVRCEYGCCWFDVDSGRAEHWSDVQTHACGACSHRTHRYGINAMVRRHREGKAYTDPRRVVDVHPLHWQWQPVYSRMG